MSTPTNPAPNSIIVEQPPAQQWRYGLYSAATLLPVDDGHWQVGGVTWSPDSCAQGGLWPGGPCNPAALPATWAMTTGNPTGLPITVTQPSPDGRPFEVDVQIPDKPSGKTLTQITVAWGAGQPTAEFLGDRPNPQPVANRTYPAVATTYTVRITMTYDDSTNSVSTIDLTWTGSGPSERTKESWGIDWETATPFVVYASVSCAPVGFSDASMRAQNRLSWNEARLVERAFWRGDEGNYPHLAMNESAPVTDVSKPGVDIVTALGLLEYNGQIETGTQLVIHAPRYLAAWAARFRLVERDGNVLRTPLGNVWAFGAGYDFTGPDGKVTDQTAWLYATGAVTVRRSNVVTNQVFDQNVNRRSVVAERSVLVTAECIRLSAKVAAPELANAVFPPVPLPNP
jgi:hypothetical protein